ncbi:hypothetical protein CN378_00190 [Bacillus sp. AFS015802]|uniref:hypothetical protein n=1 Tax=Bacillus sp. AFS015802 TaxID=2033486 RepID=UPI000BF24EE8|nr:hypothetical protein [Bacillus sp. AFS015802]PFA70726.1 hypothetical protein CN378_00190 [Bacillus sp. AFS015802]
MKAFWVKTAILGMLIFVLVGLMTVKIVVKTQEDWVKIEEKYFPASDGSDPLGISSGERLEIQSGDPSCAMKFDNGRTYKVDCDEYLDFTIGEKVKIVSIEKNTVKLRRK